MTDEVAAQSVINAYAATARPLILRFFPRNSCVASTRTTLECMARFGLQGDGLTCEFAVQDPKRKLAYVSGLRPQNRKAAMRTAATFRDLRDPQPLDAHVVAIIEYPSPNGTGPRWLIDASFDQARAAGLPIDDEPFVLPLPQSLEPIHMALDATVVVAEGVRVKVSYRGRPERDFETTPAWETDHLQPLIEIICRKMESALAQKERLQ